MKGIERIRNRIRDGVDMISRLGEPDDCYRMRWGTRNRCRYGFRWSQGDKQLVLVWKYSWPPKPSNYIRVRSYGTGIRRYLWRTVIYLPYSLHYAGEYERLEEHLGRLLRTHLDTEESMELKRLKKKFVIDLVGMN